MSTKAFAVIAGVGSGTGASVARKFASIYPIALLARNPDTYGPLVKEINGSGGKAIGISTDVSDTSSVKHAFGQIAKEFEGLPMGAAIYNVGGKFVRKPFLELSQQEFEAGYDASGRGAFLFSQAVIPELLKSTNLKYSPTLIFTGATASVKGSALCASFASGKWALRALSQSLAKEFGPQGLHVGHVIIDGVIDTKATKAYDVGGGKPDAKISPEGIADAYWHLHTQSRTAFTWEMDLRPYVEKW